MSHRAPITNAVDIRLPPAGAGPPNRHLDLMAVTAAFGRPRCGFTGTTVIHFLVFAFVGFLTLLSATASVPETRGKTLEEKSEADYNTD